MSTSIRATSSGLSRSSSNFLSSSLALISLSFFVVLAATQDSNDLCGIQVYADGFNASGSVTVPGFRVNNTYPDTNWKWTRYVSEEYDAQANDSSLWQTFGLETTPQLDLSDPGLPYTGCIIVPREVMVAGREDDGTCSGIFTSSCINEIISKVNTSAAALSGTQRGSAATFSCLQLIQSITTSPSSKCHGQWSGSISTEFLPNNFSPNRSESLSPRRCVPQNSTGHPFFGYGKRPTAPDDERYYDQAIRTPHPVIVAVWLKATDDGLDDRENDEPGWADTRLFCIPANETEPGSRNLSMANHAAGDAAGVRAPRRWETVGLVLGLGAVFNLLL